MYIDVKSGRVLEARQVPSPNCDARPDGETPSLLVVHGVSLPPGQYGGPWIDRLFTNRLDPGAHPYFAEIAELRVSAHLLVRRDGELVQYVPLQQRAWHAGQSEFGGRGACNDFSIGIEMEGCDEEPYRAVQYAVLAKLVVALFDAYPALAHNPIVGHCDIAPGRKTDPGPSFEWSHLAGQVARLGQRIIERPVPA